MESSKITEQTSLYDHLENMSVHEILTNINREDLKVADTIRKILPEISLLVEAVFDRFERGGRLFYLGAGTSGRLGVVDASEIPPTFGITDRIIGLIAGGDSAIRQAVEFAEDDPNRAVKDLEEHNLTKEDTVIGIAASGTTPYVLGAIDFANQLGALTGCIVNNPNSPVAAKAQFPIAAVVGPEFVTGSTRMKSGTAQKMILNMISTSLMIKMGRVKGNKMVHMQLTNKKLIERGVRYLMEALGISQEEAHQRLEKYGSVRKALTAS